MQDIEYYKINEVLSHKYYQVPQELFSNKLYKDNLNSDSKILYGFLLDRLTLSQKHNWVDKNGNIYLIFTREELKNKLEKLDSQKNEQNALISILGKISDYAIFLETSSNTTVGEFMNHTYMCSSRKELTSKLIEMMLYAEKENKGKRR